MMNNPFSDDFSAYKELLSKHHAEAVAVARQMAQAPSLARRADRMMNCSKFTSGILCPKCHSFHVNQASLCRDRLCPNCGWALSRRRATAIVRALDGMSAIYDFAVLHVMLSVQHTEFSDLRKMLDGMNAAVGRLLRMPRVRCHLLGCVRSLEITRTQNGFHPHFHMMWIVDPEYWHEMIEQDELCRLWQKAMDADYKPVCWIKQAYSQDHPESLKDAIYECVKYCFKPSSWRDLDAVGIAALADSLSKRRLFAVSIKPFVSVFNRALADLDRPDEEFPNTPCKRCGNNRVAVTINAEG